MPKGSGTRPYKTNNRRLLYTFWSWQSYSKVNWKLLTGRFLVLRVSFVRIPVIIFLSLVFGVQREVRATAIGHEHPHQRNLNMFNHFLPSARTFHGLLSQEILSFKSLYWATTRDQIERDLNTITCGVTTTRNRELDYFIRADVLESLVAQK